jgi:RNA-directed DNA polymerase
VVAIDLEQFFDRVCHDWLMSRLAAQSADKRVLKRIRASRHAGILENGLRTIPTEGPPPSSPLSPFLSNVVVEELDKALEARGLRCCRDGEDCNIDGRRARAGTWVRARVTRFSMQHLKRRGKGNKSAVDRPQNRSFLGCSCTGGKSPNRPQIASKVLARGKARGKEQTKRNQGRSLRQVITALSGFLRGWIGYFGVCQTPSVLRDVDRWIRHRLRCLQWQQGQVYRRRKAAWIKGGIDPELAHTTAFSAKGPWKSSHTPGGRMARNNRCFDQLGLIRLRAYPNR